ncbi:hypothetical protein DdX_02444 [Ditylenchus destructor]|uniref:Matrix-remodeling-associated protein 7 helical domain-containing protein n=1 Tax=Ditylenchus destructor TaxID=166010 RepID=A0AAD4NHN8_9BILA|nr:hypothetical protein DdX_02444 [Ditylenchus destructor]
MDTTHINDIVREFFSNPTVLLSFAIVIGTAVGLPFATLYLFRLWRYYQAIANPQPIVNDQEPPPVEGTFNPDIISELFYVPKERLVDCDEEEETVRLLPDVQQGSEAEQLEDIESVDIANETTNISDTDSVNDQPRALKEGEQSKLASSIPKKLEKIANVDDETAKTLKNLSEAGLHGKLATAQLRARTQKIEQAMSDEEREKERQIRNEQLNSIFQMMQTQGNKFGVNDKNELAEQMKLYSV